MDLIDLSHPIEHGMVTYPGLPVPSITDFVSREESRERYANQAEFQIGRIEMVANTGTYLDAPSHRYADKADVGQLPLGDVAFLPGVVIEVRERAIDVDLLKGVLVCGRAVLFHTGWSRHWRTERYGSGEHPFVTRAAAEYLVAEGAMLAGIDALNIDDSRDPARPAHTLLLGGEVLIVEHLTNLAALAGREFTFFAVPAPVRGLGSFPVRAFAAV
jgi:kynurenine formamidase